MKRSKQLLSAFLFFGYATMNAQVGINTVNPQATLDLTSKAGVADIDGFLAPRLTLAQLTAKGNSLYNTSHRGLLLYITDVSGGGNQGQRVNITSEGYYSFNGTSWQKITTADTSIYTNDGILAANRTVDLNDKKLNFKGTNANMSILATNEGQSASLYFGTPNLALADKALKAAIIAEGQNYFSKSKLHFAVNDANAHGSANSAKISDSKMTIQANGNVGVGTVDPTAKLHVNGSFRLTDGTQGADKVLTTNATGDATWRENNSAKPTIIGTIPATAAITSSGTSSPLNSGMYIDLTAGRWIVSAGLTISRINGTTNLWEHFYLSSSTSSVTQTNFTHSGPAGASSCYAGNIFPVTAETFSFIQGSSVINVTANTRIYLLLQNQANGAFIFRGNNFENYFYAVPIN